MPRWRYEWDVLMDVSEHASCGLIPQCGGQHAAVWELTRGADFPAMMSCHSLQSAMRAKGRHAGLGCHTAVQPNGLQVQFFRRPHRVQTGY